MKYSKVNLWNTGDQWNMFFRRKDKPLSSLCLADMKSCAYVLIVVNKFTSLNKKKYWKTPWLLEIVDILGM